MNNIFQISCYYYWKLVSQVDYTLCDLKRSVGVHRHWYTSCACVILDWDLSDFKVID